MAALTASALVTDENLHAEFLFNPTVDRPNGQGVWATGVRIANAAGSWAVMGQPRPTARTLNIARRWLP